VSSKSIKIGARTIGEGAPCYLIAEIGINHNGDVQNALKLIQLCKEAGFDAVKFQKRTPEISTPDSQKNVPRETPWGTMTYLDYKRRIEFGEPEYETIDAFCKELNIDWFASPWDVPSVLFLEKLGVVAFKVASASVTDHELLDAIAETGKPVIMSTGMSTEQEIEVAVERLKGSPLALLQATSTYPLDPREANLRYMHSLESKFQVPVGYSGHETGLQISAAAVGLGAKILERHVTLDRSMWGTDHSASLEPQGFVKLVRDVRIVELAMGDGRKVVYDSEKGPREKLRRVK
jgi:N-acetylneuraminate synthase